MSFHRPVREPELFGFEIALRWSPRQRGDCERNHEEKEGNKAHMERA
jgi:hypothetical protein